MEWNGMIMESTWSVPYARFHGFHTLFHGFHALFHGLHGFQMEWCMKYDMYS